MAANGRGYMRPNSAGRTPPFLIIGLLVVISILAFNYWSLSSKNNALTREIDEAEMKYRSVQVRKLDVEKRNAELSTLLDEAKKYKQAAQEKDMKLREAEQKETELNAKIDNLAGEAEVLKNDLNTCDDEVVRNVWACPFTPSPLSDLVTPPAFNRIYIFTILPYYQLYFVPFICITLFF